MEAVIDEVGPQRFEERLARNAQFLLDHHHEMTLEEFQVIANKLFQASECIRECRKMLDRCFVALPESHSLSPVLERLITSLC